MGATAVGLLVAACVFAGALFGLQLHRFLPPTHLTKDTQEVVRLGTTMLSVLTSLVLGLLIATAKSSSDRIDLEMRGYAADLILLDGLLRDLGADADDARGLLRRYVERTLQDVWLRPGGRPAGLESSPAGTLLEGVRQAVGTLQSAEAGGRWLHDQVRQTVLSLQRQRWQLIEQSGPSVRPVVLVVTVSWMVAIFAGFGLNAPRNGTVVASFLVCALAIGGAVFLILEIDSPFEGLLRVSEAPMQAALARMAP